MAITDPSLDVFAANLRPTHILDFTSDRVQAALRQVHAPPAAGRAYLQACHRFLREAVRPVYTVDELQPTSITLAKGRGSCSQRFACLESCARAAGIPTRVSGLMVKGKFWSRRFPCTRVFIPSRILLAWPQFHLEGAWVGVEALFEFPVRPAEQEPPGFTNDGETLFDVVDHVLIDFGGTTAACGAGGCDLSGFVVGDVGVFDSRDELFEAVPLFQHTIRGRVFEFFYGGRASVSFR